MISTAKIFLAEDDAIRVVCERAVSELRYGRPVVFETPLQSYALLALDTAAPAALERFAEIADGQHELFVSAERAKVLGIEARFGALMALEGLNQAEISGIAYGRAAVSLPAARPAPASFAAFSVVARMALLLPAFVVLPIETGDPRYAGCAVLPSSALKNVPDAEADFAVVARTRVPLKDVRSAEFVVFRGGLAQRDQVAIIVGTPDLNRPVPVRIHSSCITVDLFGSLKCDCGDQLREAILLIEQRDGGMLLYLDQEGRGTGIAAKMRAYGHQAEGLDTIDADALLGFEEDGRRYGAAVAMLQALGVTMVELLTNNPRKIAALEHAGFTVKRRTPVLGVVTVENHSYLATKANRSGHLLDVNAMSLPSR